MIKILAAIGLGSALMLAPVLAYADDAPKTDAPKADEKMAPKPVVHHHHHHHHHHVAVMKPVHHKAVKKMEDKKMDKPADAPKT